MMTIMFVIAISLIVISLWVSLFGRRRYGYNNPMYANPNMPIYSDYYHYRYQKEQENRTVATFVFTLFFIVVFFVFLAPDKKGSSEKGIGNFQTEETRLVTVAESNTYEN